MTNFYAHSGLAEDRSDWHRLACHLKQAAVLAADRAEKFGAADWGRVAGLLHDLGKYSLPFQGKLVGVAAHVDHSTIGAHLAVERYGQPGKMLAYAIAGHHTGLANWKGEGPPGCLAGRLAADYIDGLPRIDGWREQIGGELPAGLALPSLRPQPEPICHKARSGLACALFVRMLFSALVDADRLDTESFDLGCRGGSAPRDGWPADILARLKARLDIHMHGLSAGAIALQGDVNAARAGVLAAARETARKRPGLFSLTVPTGGGKTLASLAFALDHALAHPDRNFDRIIYVIPFTSIIEQTAGVFRHALEPHANCIVEHHSAYREPVEKERNESDNQDGRRARLARENWDAPIIVTTAVQFFESLFSNRPGRCRKLHNIARSIVILDEVQTLPLPLLRPCVAALDELARNYGASIVLCTATQPALLAKRRDGSPGFKGGLADVCEIAPQPVDLYRRLKRVTVKAPLKLDHDAALARHLRGHEMALCVVNTRKHARELHKVLKDEETPGLFHLSASLCPVHRSQKLKKIKAAVACGRPCLVIATTVVEAGVDIDFPTVYRAMAGLDSIAQAAGRCNREGKRSKRDSIVQLFEMADRSTIPELRKFEDAARGVLRQPSHAADPLSIAAIEAYFSQLYWGQEQGRIDGLDPHGIATNPEKYAINSDDVAIPFADIARDFKMIKSPMEPVIVPYDGEARQLIKDLETTDQVRDIARKLQPYMVNVPTQAFAALRQADSVQLIAKERFPDQFFWLVADPGRLPPNYHEDIGFDWSDVTYRDAESNLF